MHSTLNRSKRIRAIMITTNNSPRRKRWPLQPHSSMLSSLFSSPKLTALASFQDLYVGLEPYKNSNQLWGGIWRKTAPAVFGLLAALELHSSNRRAGGECMAPIFISCVVRIFNDPKPQFSHAYNSFVNNRRSVCTHRRISTGCRIDLSTVPR